MICCYIIMSLLRENPQRVTRQMRTDYEVVDVGLKDMWNRAKKIGGKMTSKEGREELYEKGKKNMQKIAKGAGEAIESFSKAGNGGV
jgi:hypothetical protein